jgi:N-acetylglucosamine-6-sulfatase
VQAIKRFLVVVCGLALLAFLPLVGDVPVQRANAATLDGDAPTRPNIVLLISDDQAWSAMSRDLMPAVYSQLVDQGVLFRRAYVNTSLCCPSRAQILTGLYEHDTGVDGNEVPLTRPTIVQALHESGYRTMLAGKYLNSWNTCEPRPEFDRWSCVVSHEPSSNSLLDPMVNVDGTWEQIRGYQPDVLGSQLSSFISTTPDDQPFFAMYAPTSPHMPADDPRYDSMEVPPPRGPAWNVNTRTEGNPLFARRTPFSAQEIADSDDRYVRMAHATRSLDDAVAGILSSIGDRANNTIVVYLSDNGFLYGEHRRFGKNDAWEESVRVPMVVRYPAALAPDRAFATNALVQNVDIAPTLAEVAGIRWASDGRSILPFMTGEDKAIRSAALIEHCRGETIGTIPCTGLLFDGGNTDTPGFEGIVTERWKYVRYDDGSVQLIDLKHDPHELHNLARRPGARELRTWLATRLDRRLQPSATTTIATGPGDALGSRVATFSYFSPSRLATYRCRLVHDGEAEPWHACPSGGTAYGDVDEGRYRFQVVGTDGHGHTDPTPASRSFTVEPTSGPGVRLLTHPDISQTSDTAAFTYTTSVAHPELECRLSSWPSDEAPWTTCDPLGVSFSGLVDGAYLFEIRAHDPQTGTLGKPGAGWLFSVDTAGPVETIVSHPDQVTRSLSGSFRFIPDELTGKATTCALDGRAPVRCSGGHFRVSRLRPGNHHLAIRAVDRLGNVADTTYQWTVVLHPPELLVNDGPVNQPAGTDAVFYLWSNGDPPLFLCRLDGGPLMPCLTKAVLSGLKAGPHDLTAYSTDAAFNRSAPQVWHWVVVPA